MPRKTTFVFYIKNSRIGCAIPKTVIFNNSFLILLNFILNYREFYRHSTKEGEVTNHHDKKRKQRLHRSSRKTKIFRS